MNSTVWHQSLGSRDFPPVILKKGRIALYCSELIYYPRDKFIEKFCNCGHRELGPDRVKSQARHHTKKFGIVGGLLKISTGLCASSRNLFFNFSSSVERQMKWWALSSAEGPLRQWCGGYSVCVINLILANSSRSLKRIPMYRKLFRRRPLS